MAKNIVAGIDAGSHSIKIAVLEDMGAQSLPRILSLTKTQSAGIKQGYIIDLDMAIEALYKAVRATEKNIGMRLKRAFIGSGGVALAAHTIEHTISVARGDYEITDLDISRAMEEAEEKLPDTANREVLNAINLSFKLDGKKVLGDPKGWKGNKLDVTTLFLTNIGQHIHDLKLASEKAGIAVDHIVPFPLAQSLVSISRMQKESGCMLVDIGSETVSLAVFDDGVLISTAVLPIGSLKITEDIAIRFKIDLDEAEHIKTGVEIQGMSEKKKLQDVVEARLSDIFELIENHLKKLGRSGLLPAGVIFTGGGSNIDGIVDLAKDSLDLPARLSLPLTPKSFNIQEEDSYGQKLLVRDPSFANAYGLAVYGLNPEYSEESLGVKLGRRTKGSLVRMVRQFLP